MSDQHAETLKYEATEIERLEAELETMTERALNGEAAIATLMDVINPQKARLPYSQAAHLTTLEADWQSEYR